MRVSLWLAAAAAVAILLSAVPAYAASDGVEVSLDGTTFSAATPAALFAGTTEVVPGDVLKSTFFVRNASNRLGNMRIALRDINSPDIALADALEITTSTPNNAGVPVSLADVGACKIVVDDQTLKSGETVKVTVTARLRDMEGTAGQKSAANLAYHVGLTDAAGPRPTAADCDTDPQVSVMAGQPAAGKTHQVGAPIYESPESTIAFACILLGAGWFLLVAKRRRRKDREQQQP